MPPKSIGDVLVAYSATEMPISAIEQIHKDTSREVEEGERTPEDAMRIFDLLLYIAVLKLKAAA